MRHSHIALRRSLSSLAAPTGAEIEAATDDIGPYRFFDMTLHNNDGANNRFRFASHAGDKMVHVLADDIDNLDHLAVALMAVGITHRAGLSISVDHQGQPLRDARAIKQRIAILAKRYELQRQSRARSGSFALTHKMTKALAKSSKTSRQSHSADDLRVIVS